MRSKYLSTFELDKLIRKKARLYGCRLIRIEVRPNGLMELVYTCGDIIQGFLVPINLDKTSCYYFMHGKMEKIPHTLLEDVGIRIEEDSLRNTFCIACLNRRKAIVHAY